jgi:hypothetical protein
MKKAGETLLTNVANLLKVKTIITLTVIIAVSVLAVKGKEIDAAYLTIAGTIIAFYFSKSDSKKEE